MLELLSEAKTNFVDNEADPEDPSTGVVKGQAGDIFKALEAIIRAQKALDTAVSRGIIHRNNAARRLSRLMKKFNQAVLAS